MEEKLKEGEQKTLMRWVRGNRGVATRRRKSSRLCGEGPEVDWLVGGKEGGKDGSKERGEAVKASRVRKR